jgi:protein involved in polysaccharide export with SLBB domain
LRSVLGSIVHWPSECAILFSVCLITTACNDYSAAEVPPVPSVSTAPELYQPEKLTSYAITPGDNAVINSYYHPELKQTVTIQPDGKISLLLVGEVTAAGKTAPQLAAELTRAYGKYLNDAKLTVTLTSTADQSIYIGGEVTKPSVLSIKGELTLTQVIAEAGGFLTTSNREQVLILRQTPDGHYRTMQANPEAILRNEADEIYLRRHDVVFVPKTKIAKVDLFVDQYLSQILPRWLGVGFGYSLGMLGGMGNGATAVAATPTITGH